MSGLKSHIPDPQLRTVRATAPSGSMGGGGGVNIGAKGKVVAWHTDRGTCDVRLYNGAVVHDVMMTYNSMSDTMGLWLHPTVQNYDKNAVGPDGYSTDPPLNAPDGNIVAYIMWPEGRGSQPILVGTRPTEKFTFSFEDADNAFLHVGKAGGFEWLADGTWVERHNGGYFLVSQNGVTAPDIANQNVDHNYQSPGGPPSNFVWHLDNGLTVIYHKEGAIEQNSGSSGGPQDITLHATGAIHLISDLGRVDANGIDLIRHHHTAPDGGGNTSGPENP